MGGSHQGSAPLQNELRRFGTDMVNLKCMIFPYLDVKRINHLPSMALKVEQTGATMEGDMLVPWKKLRFCEKEKESLIELCFENRSEPIRTVVYPLLLRAVSLFFAYTENVNFEGAINLLCELF